jgi:hypothetical protein
MKHLTNIIQEKLILTKSKQDSTYILNNEIKDLNHLKDMLIEYYKMVGNYKLQTTSISKRKVKWKNSDISMLGSVYGLNDIFVEDHFSINFTYNYRTIYQLRCGLYKDYYVMQVNLYVPGKRSLDNGNIIGFPFKYGNSPSNPLKPGRNLLDWINELMEIKSGGEVYFANKYFLRLFKFM